MMLASKIRVCGSLQPPGDKSIAHRVAILSALARGVSIIDNYAPGDDCRRTLNVLGALGVPIEHRNDQVRVSGQGYFGFRAPSSTLQAGNSGSTARMVCGLLAGQPFDSRLDGDESLRHRPMRRVIEPLGRMGAHIETYSAKDSLPLSIHGDTKRLQGIEYQPPVASAQIKTAILLAGLHAEGETLVHEPLASRNHTELALLRFGVPVEVRGTSVALRGGAPLEPTNYRLPGDISSAAFFITAAAALPGSELSVHHVGLNETRAGFLKVLQSMGAQITVEEIDETQQTGDEKVGTVRVRGSELTGTQISAEQVPALIDEVPILSIAAVLAQGETTIRGASELRLKESDRLQVIAQGLRAMGAEVEELPDGLRIGGGRRLEPARLESCGDHRMAMAWAIASLAQGGECEIVGKNCVGISYPGFWKELARLTS